APASSNGCDAQPTGCLPGRGPSGPRRRGGRASETEKGPRPLLGRGPSLGTRRGAPGHVSDGQWTAGTVVTWYGRPTTAATWSISAVGPITEGLMGFSPPQNSIELK